MLIYKQKKATAHKGCCLIEQVQKATPTGQSVGVAFLFREEGFTLKFIVNIEEVVSENFEVEADDKDEALEIVMRAYNSGEIVLEPGELVEKKIAVFDEANNEWSEYEEF